VAVVCSVIVLVRYRLSGSKRRQRIISKKLMAEGGTTLEYTPTWVVAVVCSVIVLISLIVERTLHYLGKVTHHQHSLPPIYNYICYVA
jgi:ABC-type Fe3+ transport system permease subunit